MQRLDLGKTSYKDLVFARSDLIRFVGEPNESLRLITHFRARFRQTSYKDLVFARGEFLSVVGA